jgi:hypothetical protein
MKLAITDAQPGRGYAGFKLAVNDSLYSFQSIEFTDGNSNELRSEHGQAPSWKPSRIGWIARMRQNDQIPAKPDITT